MQSEGCGLYVLININTKPAKINKKSNTGLNDISSQSYFLQTSTDPSTYRANQLTNSISCDCQSEGQIKRYLRFPLTQKNTECNEIFGVSRTIQFWLELICSCLHPESDAFWEAIIWWCQGKSGNTEHEKEKLQRARVESLMICNTTKGRK